MSKTVRVQTPKQQEKPVGFYKEGGKTRPITKKGPGRRKVVRRSNLSKKDVASSAQVAELTRFMTGYLSGRNDVRVRFHGANDLFAASEGYGAPVIMLPSWAGYELPMDGYETWRVYRQGTWHETQHIKYTPRGMYGLLPEVPGLHPNVTKTLVNIIEDRRIEDLGAEYHKGVGPERDYTQGYAYALRPKVDEIPVPEAQILEGFTQKMLIGRLNGMLPENYEEIVDEAVEYALEKLGEMKKHPAKSEKITDALEKLVEEVADKLKLVNTPPPDGQGQSQDPGQDGEGEEGEGGTPGPGQGQDQGQGDPDAGSGSGADEDDDEDDEALEGIEDEDDDEPKDIPHIDWDETFRAPNDPELAKKAKKDVDKKMDEFFDKEREDAEKAGRIKRGDGDTDPSETYVDDIEKAIKGTEDSRSEFESIQKGGDEPSELAGMFTPLSDLAPTGPYVDSKFKREMDKRLKAWRTGLSKKYDKTGHMLDVDSLIRTKGQKKPKPFVKIQRRSVKGKKYLFVLDFSGSISGVQEEYKKAIINTMEALDTIGAKTAVFGFGGFDVAGSRTTGGFKVKTFEERRWRPVHASKVAGVHAAGMTPTGNTYARLEKYIKKNRPQYVITLTDGEANSTTAVADMNKQLKKHTKMVAFGIAGSEHEEERMKRYFDDVDYRKSFTVSTDEINKLPGKLVNMIAPR
ncbi:VWA domain-containing protein [Candidatus Bathyarchaeota archaeon]|nr:VWA domain-containing protein [Candidatus Bathyarchaeota archaeon]